MEKLTVAAVQMHTTSNKEENLEKAERFIDEAASRGAKMVSLPELFNFMGKIEEMPKYAEPIPGPTVERLQQKAMKNRIYIIAGSILEKSLESARPFNTSLLITPDGEIGGKYRKTHLFNIYTQGNKPFRESEIIEPGKNDCVLETKFGMIGLTICYDLRFPELYRSESAKGARIIFSPSGFLMLTGKDHWFPLIRARAIENHIFLVAPNQVGELPGTGQTFFGHSAIVDPWGIVLASAGDFETVIVANLDFNMQKKIREMFLRK